MGQYKKFGDKAFNPYGGFDAYIWNSYANAYEGLGMVKGVRYRPSFGKKAQKEQIAGFWTSVQERADDFSADLSMTLLEPNNPRVLQLAYGDSVTAPVIDNTVSVAVDTLQDDVYDTSEKIVRHPYALISESDLPAP